MGSIRECQNQEEISQCALSMGRRKERRDVVRVEDGMRRLRSWPFWKLAQVVILAPGVNNPLAGCICKLDD